MAPNSRSSPITSLNTNHQTGIFGTGKDIIPQIFFTSIYHLLRPLPFMTGTIEKGGTGPHKILSYTTHPSLPSHTIYAPPPSSLSPGTLLSVILWGNGAGVGWGGWFSRFLVEIASHGYFVIASGIPSMKGILTKTKWTDMIAAMDWLDVHAGKGEYRHVDKSRIAAMGQSLGGLQALSASLDPRVKVTCIFNSGLLNPGNMVYFERLHAPVALFQGGPTDIAFENGERDYENLPEKIPAIKLNLPVGHMGTFGDVNGDKFAEAAVLFLDWQIKGDVGSGSHFLDSESSKLKNAGWDVVSKNWEGRKTPKM